jgi:hypothetical protein
MKNLRRMIKWNVWDERYIHFFQPNGINQEMDMYDFNSCICGKKISTLNFDGWIDTLEIDMRKPLFMVACNTEGQIWVIRPKSISLTKLQLANLLDFANEINVNAFCRLRTKEQVVNAYISNRANRF